MNYSLHQDVFTGTFTALLLGGEFPNCYGQGRNKTEAVASLKIRVYQLRRKQHD